MSRFFLLSTLGSALFVWAPVSHGDTDLAEQCAALTETPNLSLYMAEWQPAGEAGAAHCYVKGLIAPNIHYYVQLPPPDLWNGRFLNWGDGGFDGDLDYAPHRVAEGYAVANSNMGHDSGSEPGGSFAFNNRQAEIDYGYRHLHTTVQAAKTVIQAYYGTAPNYSYHEGCSTGGRQGLMAAQRFPADFDGIVAGAPAAFLQRLNLEHNWAMQHMFRDNFAGALSFDTTGDGKLNSLTKAGILTEEVLAHCDANDGITDGVVDDPMSCNFVPSRDLSEFMCPENQNADNCFTTDQIEAMEALYDGPSDSSGVSIYKGKALGSEIRWPGIVIPHEGNNYSPGVMGLTSHYVNYLFYETDPGVPTMEPTNLALKPDPTREPPEYAWWQFDFDDFTAGKGDTMRDITDADDPDLARFLIQRGGKLLIYHGWADTVIPPEPIIDYYGEVLSATFEENTTEAEKSVRLFMVPGMAHCRGGPGPNTWDRLAPMVEWVENGTPPDSLTVTHSTNGQIDNERILCPYPQQAKYKGPENNNDPVNWVAANFTCE